MTSITTDRLNGVSGSVAIKAPCRVATTGNIVLSGLQTVDVPFSITVAEGDRVLVRLQTNQSENGIYIASASNWVRAVDFNGAKDIASGTYVRVNQGECVGLWYVSTADPIVIGTTSLVFTKVFDGTFPNLSSLSGTSDNITQGVANLFLTTAERAKLNGIAVGAEVNVNADWNASSGDAQILNKPTLGTLASQNANSVNLTGTFAFGGVTFSAVTGNDPRIVSGTAGTNGHLASWNSDGDVVGSGVAVANVLQTSAIGSTVQGYDVDTLKADETKTLSAGFDTNSFNIGTITSGTVTPNKNNGNVQHYTNNGAHTLAPPATVTVITVEIVNGASAGAINVSGFTIVDGAFTTTVGHKFVCDVRRANSITQLNIRAAQ